MADAKTNTSDSEEQRIAEASARAIRVFKDYQNGLKKPPSEEDIMIPSDHAELSRIDMRRVDNHNYSGFQLIKHSLQSE